MSVSDKLRRGVMYVLRIPPKDLENVAHARADAASSVIDEELSQADMLKAELRSLEESLASPRPSHGQEGHTPGSHMKGRG